MWWFWKLHSDCVFNNSPRTNDLVNCGRSGRALESCRCKRAEQTTLACTSSRCTLGRLPIELAALRDCKEEVAMLFPLTSPIPNVQNWSIDGVIAYAKIEDKKPLDEKLLEKRRIMLKSQADRAFKQKEYKVALECYDVVISHRESATLYANRSLCKLLLGDGEGALSDALRSRMLRPDWAKACYRQAAAHMLLKEYKQACDALSDAQKLNPGNDDIERELRRAKELMKNPPEGLHAAFISSRA